MFPAIFNSNIGTKTVQTVNARDLHNSMGVGKVFRAWISGRIEKYGFEENVDYVTTEILTRPESDSSKARPQKAKEYHISVNMAKELAMVENNEKGRQVRKYFIECEDKLLEQAKGLSDPLIRSAQATPHLMAAFEAMGIKGNHAAIATDNVNKRYNGISLLDMSGNLHLRAESNDRIITPTQLGKLMQPNMSAVAVNKMLERKGFQDKKVGQWRPTDKGAMFAVVLDTGKKHSDGTAVTQLKWKESIIAEVE